MAHKEGKVPSFPEKMEERVRNDGDGKIKVGRAESKGKVSEEAGKPEFLGIKLRKGILLGRRGGALTPVPSWKMELNDEDGWCGNDEKGDRVSARKLGASLWELHRLLPSTLPSNSGKKMRKGVRKIKQSRDKGIQFDHRLGDPCHSHAEKQIHPPRGVSLSRQVAASIIQHHKFGEGNSQAMPPLSSTSFSSMEIAPYNHARTPSSSSDIKGRPGLLGYNLNTSTELLGVLNRIWVLEEQHASNASLIKALKLERDHARARVQELIQIQQADRREIDNLMKRLTELMRKSKEHQRLEAAVRTVRKELEDERRMRGSSESLHRKLARELADVKLALSKSIKELKGERRTRSLLEDLCDQFARGIGDYEQEVHALKQKYEKNHSDREDKLILHIAEAWLDERVQMKLAGEKYDPEQKNMIIDRIQCQIEVFLQAKQSNNSKFDIHFKEDLKDDCLHRHSLESFPLNVATGSGPQYAAEEDSAVSDSHSFSINKSSGEVKKCEQTHARGRKTVADLETMIKPSSPKAKAVSHERIKAQSSSCQGQLEDKIYPSRLQGRKQFTERVIVSHTDNKNEDKATRFNEIEVPIYQKSENCEAQDGLHFRNTNHHINDKLVRSQSLVSDGSGVRSEIKHKEKSDLQKPLLVLGSKDEALNGENEISSPTQKWDRSQRSPELELSESSTKLLESVKKNSLKAKLLEARLEGQQARLRAT